MNDDYTPLVEVLFLSFVSPKESERQYIHVTEKCKEAHIWPISYGYSTEIKGLPYQGMIFKVSDLNKIESILKESNITYMLT